jgi:uncharacterized membrane protein
MKIIRLLSIAVFALLPLSSLLVQAVQPEATIAADQTEQVILTTRFPAFSGTNKIDYTFDIELQYKGGNSSKIFDLSASGPNRFVYSLSQAGQNSSITSIKLDPNGSYPESIQLRVQQNPLDPAAPGDYTVKLQASSGNIKGSVDLSIRIQPVYAIRLGTSDSMLGYSIDANKENPVKLQLANNGNAPLENINLTYSIKGNPAGWEIKFDPATVDIIAAQNTKEVTMIVKPPEKAPTGGDYEVLITAKTRAVTASDVTTLRFTIKESLFWTIVPYLAAALIVAGVVAALFLFGKRSG